MTATVTNAGENATERNRTKKGASEGALVDPSPSIEGLNE